MPLFQNRRSNCRNQIKHSSNKIKIFSCKFITWKLFIKVSDKNNEKTFRPTREYTLIKIILSILGLSTFRKVIALGNTEIIEWYHSQERRAGKISKERWIINTTTSLSSLGWLRFRDSILKITMFKKVRDNRWKYWYKG
jgi:hypothetical protein